MGVEKRFAKIFTIGTAVVFSTWWFTVTAANTRTCVEL